MSPSDTAARSTSADSSPGVQSLQSVSPAAASSEPPSAGFAPVAPQALTPSATTTAAPSAVIALRNAIVALLLRLRAG